MSIPLTLAIIAFAILLFAHLLYVSYVTSENPRLFSAQKALTPLALLLCLALLTWVLIVFSFERASLAG